MLAIHWSAVNNTKKIMRNGIVKSKNGVYCFPLTGHRDVDKWWVNAFNQYRYRRDKKRYNGIIFRIAPCHLPAYFGHWIGATSRDSFEKPIKSLEELEQEVRNSIIWRIGESHVGYGNMPFLTSDELLEIGKKEIIKDKKLYNQTLNDHDFIRFIFEDCQFVLEGSISPKCIIKVVSDRDEFGRVLRARKRQKEAYGEMD